MNCLSYPNPILVELKRKNTELSCYIFLLRFFSGLFRWNYHEMEKKTPFNFSVFLCRVLIGISFTLMDFRNKNLKSFIHDYTSLLNLLIGNPSQSFKSTHLISTPVNEKFNQNLQHFFHFHVLAYSS